MGKRKTRKNEEWSAEGVIIIFCAVCIIILLLYDVFK
jgi:hypothetical protein